MAGLNAYYLISPFNLLLLLFPTSEMPSGIALITLLKTGCCGLTFCLGILPAEIKKEKRFEKIAACMAFCAAYALMAYNIAYQQNLMWLDSVMMLPLVVKGIRKICKRETPFLYLFSLFAAIVTNYYIGFMICIFSVLFFLYYFLCSSQRKKGSFIFLSFAAVSVLGGGLGMIVILPALKSLEGGKAIFSFSAILDTAKVFPFRDFALKFLIGSLDMG